MKRLVFATPALLPLLLASCQILPPAGMAPALALASPGQQAADPSTSSAIETAAAIARGEVGNAISGTIELPINLRALASLTRGAPPVSVHAFRVTGPLIREAKVSLFWRDDSTVGYIVDGVPADYPVVLAATVEPGVVVRALVPPASTQNPARGQTIDLMSETIVLKCYQMGIIPPVGLGGTAEVIRQGGLAPASAAEANDKAADELEKVAATSWGKALPEANEAITSLRHLAQAQRGVSAQLKDKNGSGNAPSMSTTEVYSASISADETLARLENSVTAHAKETSVPAEVATMLESLIGYLSQAAATDIPEPASLVPSTGTFNLLEMIFYDEFFPYRWTRSGYLFKVYKDIGFISVANTGFFNPNGRPFSELEIKEAFDEGRGPYRTDCAQVNFSGDVNCRIASDPLQQKTNEILLSREVDLLSKKIKELESAVTEALRTGDDLPVLSILAKHPAITNFISDDIARWKTPVGTWRLRLTQNMGIGPELITQKVEKYGLTIVLDSEMFISPAGKEQRFGEDDVIQSEFLGTASIWMPDRFSSSEEDSGTENLNNFSLRFYWDAEDRTLTEGEIRGERREADDGRVRTNYSAHFDADMVSGSHIRGFWYNEDSNIAGRFELIRGTASFEI